MHHIQIKLLGSGSSFQARRLLENAGFREEPGYIDGYSALRGHGVLASVGLQKRSSGSKIPDTYVVTLMSDASLDISDLDALADLKLVADEVLMILRELE